MGNVNYIKGLYGPVRVSYPLAFSPSGIIDPTTGHTLSAYAIIGGAGYSTTYPETSSLASARFIEWNLKTTNTGSGEVYGDYMSLQSAGTGTGYVYTKGALAKSVTGGYVAELGACYYKSQLTAGTVTGQNYVGFFEYVVDSGVTNMPSGGILQLDDIVDGSLNAVHGYIAIRTYGGTPFSNLFNIMDHTTGTGKLFYGCTLKNRIGTTAYYIPLSTVENTFTFSGATVLAGNVTFGTSGTDTVTFNAKLGSQLYANLTGADYTILKIHNHATTAEIGGLETKGELVNTTGTVTGLTASWSYVPTGATGAPDGVSANSNAMAISSASTVTAGNITGVHGEVQLQGTLNGATVNATGVSGVLSGAGANTLVLHMAGVASTMSTGLINPTTGTLSYYLANSTSTVIVDNLLCMVGAAYITNFASFDAVGGCLFENVAIPNVNTSHALRIVLGATPLYIPVFTDLSWGS